MDTATQCKNADAGFGSRDSECPRVVDFNHHRNQLDLRLEAQQLEWCFKAPNRESAEDSVPSIMDDSNQWALMGSFYEFGVTELESQGSSASEFVPVLANNSEFSGVCSDGGDFTFCDNVDSAGLYHSHDSITLDQSLTGNFPTVAMSETSFNNFLEFKSRELLDDQKFRNRDLALEQQRFQPDNNSGQNFSKNCLKRRITEEENVDEPATTLTATAWQDACKSSRTVYDNNAARSNLGQKSKPRSSNDPQSIAARLRRERISERLKILQDLVPNGSKVDLVTMLEKAINYVKFLQLQIKVLATDEYWAKEEEQVMPRIMKIEDAMEAVACAEANKKKQQQAGGHV